MRREPPLILIEGWHVAITNLGSRLDIELIDTLVPGDTAHWLICEHNQQGDQHGTRPIGNGIDAEIKPLRQEHDFRWHAWDALPIILLKQCQCDLGEDVRAHNAAHCQNTAPSPTHEGLVCRYTAQFQGEIGLHRGADFRWPPVENWPATIG